MIYYAYIIRVIILRYLAGEVMSGFRSGLTFKLKCMLIIVFAATIAACGRVSLSITDAPIDTAEAVVLVFTGVEIRSVSGDIVKVDFEPHKSIDLMTLTEGISEVLLNEESLQDDKYDQVKLKLDLDASFVTIDGADFPVTIPVDAQDDLQVDKEFEIKTGSDSLFTIDFDLRKSLFDPEDGTDEYILRPNLRMVDNSLAGTVNGSVDASLLSLNIDCFDNSGAVTAVVYVFRGKDISPDDIDGNATEPLSSSRVQADLSYTAAFLEEGDYTLSLTCEATMDDPATDDSINFTRTNTVTVIKEQTSTLDFTL
jgi:hypothetical protein